MCTQEACSPITGHCVLTAVVCSDDDACTFDQCQPGKGCKSAPITCDPCSSPDAPKDIHCGGGPAPFCSFPPSCYQASCSVTAGCSFVNKCIGCTSEAQCADNNACTVDECLPCGPSPGWYGGCVTTLKVCNDGSPCTLDQCNQSTGACSFPPRDCSDTNPCTFDSCDPTAGGCQHLPGACDG